MRRNPTLLRSFTLLAASSLSLASLAPLGCSGSVATSASTSPGDGFPVGTYTRCAQGNHVAAPNLFLSSAGFQAKGATFTVEKSGSTLTATYLDQNGKTSTFDFAPTTSTSATLASTGEVLPGFAGVCILGPGDTWTYPAPMDTTAGVMTYDEGTVFVTLEGTVESDAGTCGAGTGPAGPTPGSIWLVCDERQGGAPSPEPIATEAAAAQLPVGPYACASLVAMYDAVGATTDNAISDGNGTLTLTQDGAAVTAAYTGDPSVTGTLHLTATTATTAVAEAEQSMTAPCTVPISIETGTGPSPTPVTLPITAGSVTVVGSTLYVSFAGTMNASSSCPDAQLAATLVCSKP